MARCSKDLPSELVDGIFSLLDDETDILRSGSVCRLWRDSAVRRARSLPAGHQVLHSDGMEFHLYKHSINLVGDPVQGCWLVKVADRHHFPVGKRLLNPLSESPFRLDSLPENIPSVLPMRRFRMKELHQVYVLRNTVNWSVIYRKAAISWSPEKSGEFVLLTIKGGGLAKFDSVSQKWTLIADRSSFRDVIVHKGELLGVDIAGRVVIVDKDDNDGEERLIVAATGSPRLLGKKYLVQSIDGELLLVENYQRTNLLVAGMFGFHPEGKLKVFKLNEDEKTWVEVQDLGDDVLFLGYNSAFALSSSSDLHGNARNRIFFTDNMSWPGENEIMDAFQGMYVFNFVSRM